jgi:hypothetical protein
MGLAPKIALIDFWHFGNSGQMQRMLRRKVVDWQALGSDRQRAAGKDRSFGLQSWAHFDKTIRLLGFRAHGRAVSLADDQKRQGRTPWH